MSKSKATSHPSAIPAPIADAPEVLTTVSGCLSALDRGGWRIEPIRALRAIYKAEQVTGADGTVSERHGRTATRMTAEAVYPWSPREFQSVKALAKWIARSVQSGSGTAAKGEDSVRAALQAHGVTVEILNARAEALAKRSAPVAK